VETLVWRLTGGNGLQLRIPFDGSGNSGLEINAAGDIIESSANVDNGQWTHFSVTRRNGTLFVYVNGVEDVSTASTSDVSDTTPDLFIGASRENTAHFVEGSLALLRISATAPTAEQIKKIYEDEKFLFQENAQATLYGSSDAVTALAHDPVTDLLHVGTSAGRSVFQGLRRVDNTTDSVSTAISASNNLIVEQ